MRVLTGDGVTKVNQLLQDLQSLSVKYETEPLVGAGAEAKAGGAAEEPRSLTVLKQIIAATKNLVEVNTTDCRDRFINLYRALDGGIGTGVPSVFDQLSLEYAKCLAMFFDDFSYEKDIEAGVRKSLSTISIGRGKQTLESSISGLNTNIILFELIQSFDENGYHQVDQATSDHRTKTGTMLNLMATFLSGDKFLKTPESKEQFLCDVNKMFGTDYENFDEISIDGMIEIYESGALAMLQALEQETAYARINELPDIKRLMSSFEVDESGNFVSAIDFSKTNLTGNLNGLLRDVFVLEKTINKLLSNSAEKDQLPKELKGMFKYCSDHYSSDAAQTLMSDFCNVASLMCSELDGYLRSKSGWFVGTDAVKSALGHQLLQHLQAHSLSVDPNCMITSRCFELLKSIFDVHYKHVYRVGSKNISYGRLGNILGKFLPEIKKIWDRIDMRNDPYVYKVVGQKFGFDIELPTPNKQVAAGEAKLGS